MKVGIVCFPTYGGSGVVATELAHELAERGHEVHLISSSIPVRLRTYSPNIYFHEVRQNEYPVFESPLYGLHIAATITQVNSYIPLDIIHAHYALPHAVSAILARQILRDSGSFKIITTLHGTDVTLVGVDPSFFPITKFALENSDCLTAVSKYLAGVIHNHFGIREDFIRVIPNFVDIERFKPLHLTREDFKPPFNLVHISNFRPVKRPLLAIRALEHLQDLPARLFMVGDGPERSKCQQYVIEKNLTDRVTFLGKQEDIVPILQQAHVFLLPSDLESFGLAGLEAMSCGVPVVAMRTGGLPELIEDGVQGFCVEKNRIELFARRIRDILTNPDLWWRMRAKARERALQFDARRIIPLYIELYKDVLAHKC